VIEAKAVSQLTGTPLTDTQSGYRFMRSEVLTEMLLRAAGYEGELELLIKACKRGQGVVEIPIATRYTEGKPSSYFRPVRDTWLICRTFLQALFWR
jgi:hypothetical protein